MNLPDPNKEGRSAPHGWGLVSPQEECGRDILSVSGIGIVGKEAEMDAEGRLLL
jgi:hypothetical protein